MTRSRADAYVLQDRRTGMYWCEGLRDDRKRGWHLLRSAATSYRTQALAIRGLRDINIDASLRARIDVVGIYAGATPPIESIHAPVTC